MKKSKFISVNEMASILGVSIDCIRHWKQREYGPKRYEKNINGMKRIFFNYDEAKEWANNQGYGWYESKQQ